MPDAIAMVLVPEFADWEFGPLAGAGHAFYGVDIAFASPDGGRSHRWAA